MRVLFVTNLPWVLHLGAARQQVELAEALSELGVDVAHLADRDMGYRAPRTKVEHVLRNGSPAVPAVRALRRSGSSFDVLDVHQGLAPVTSKDLGLDSTLVMRSAGLETTYAAWKARERAGGRPGRLITRPMRARQRRRLERDHLRSYVRADLAIALNGQERADLERLRGTRPTVQLTVGMAQERIDAMGEHRSSAGHRLGERRVVFVGYWSSRKGADDWSRIVADVWRSDPSVRFRFLGTNLSDADLRGALELEDPDDPRIEHHSRFAAEELPALVADATVALLPSYVEGYPTVTVEAAAAGIPTVAYDAVGTRELPARLTGDWLVPPGDTRSAARRVLSALDLAADDYRAVSELCVTLAAEHSWSHLAPRTLDAYAAAGRAR